jgi:hypothetical protein
MEELEINPQNENNLEKEEKQSINKNKTQKREHEVIVNNEKSKIIFFEKEMLIKTKNEKYLIPYELISKSLNMGNNLKNKKSKIIKGTRMLLLPIFFITLIAVDFNIVVKMLVLSFLLYSMYLTYFNKKEVLLKISNGKMSYDYIKIQFKDQLFIEELSKNSKSFLKKKITLARFF